jgi:hypothetical protein
MKRQDHNKFPDAAAEVEMASEKFPDAAAEGPPNPLEPARAKWMASGKFPDAAANGGARTTNQ